MLTQYVGCHPDQIVTTQFSVGREIKSTMSRRVLASRALLTDHANTT